MNQFNKTVVLILAIAFIPFPALAESSVEDLSAEVRTLLKKEMAALEKGMKLIIPAVISGNMQDIEKIAGQMKNSYILKQQMSKHQMHELHQKLPHGFLKQDGEFHRLAGMLEHVAKEKNTELVGFYYSKLVESCVSCHSDYATHRFPKLDSHQPESSHETESSHEH